MTKNITNIIYDDVDDIAQAYIDQGICEQPAYELAYKICETGLKPPYEGKQPTTQFKQEYENIPVTGIRTTPNKETK